MKKFVPFVLAVAAVTMIGATAQADRGRGRPDPRSAAQIVEQDAYSLVQILARGGPANTQLIQNGGMVAKEAHDLVQNPFSPRELSDVLRAFQILSDNFRWQRGQSRMAEDAFRRLDYDVQDLEDACNGGGSDGRDGRDGRADGGFDGQGQDDGRDGGFDGQGQDDGSGDWGQNDDGQGDGQGDGQADGDWGQRH